jgi:autotransporter-associated beta strand protein
MISKTGDMVMACFPHILTRAAFLLVLGAVALVLPTPAVAQNVSWDNGGGDRLWTTAANWSNNVVPSGATTIRLDSALSGTNSILLPAGGTYPLATAVIYHYVVAASSGTTTVTWQKTGTGANPQVVTSGLQVGNGSFFSSGGNYVEVTGRLLLDGVDLTMGSTSNRSGGLTLGLRTTGDNGLNRGEIVGSNSVFKAYLSTMILGDKGSGAGGVGAGRIDLSASSTAGSLLDISGDARLGNAAPDKAFTQGNLLMTSGSVGIGGSLLLGLAGQEGCRGTAIVTNTPVTVTGSAVFGGRFRNGTTETWRNSTAEVTSNVSGQIGGLDLTSSATSALTISATDASSRAGAYNRIAVNFQADPGAGGYDSDGWYWGFRWAGNHQTTLRNYISGTTGMLQISGTGLSAALQSGSAAGYVTYDAGSNKTYVGITVFGTSQTADLANVAGSLLRLNNTNRSVGALQGLAGSLVELGSGTLSLGANNQATTFSGVISGAGGLIKQGTGLQVLAGANTYAGLTDVQAGGLSITGSVAGNAAVAGGARLGGSGGLGGSLSLADGAFLVFDPASSGLQMTAGNNVTFNSSFSMDSLRNADGTTVNWVGVLDGSYTLLANTTTDFSGLTNFGPGAAKDLGAGRSAYFTNTGGLQVVVVPEPATLALAGLGSALLAWAASRRRRAGGGS